MPSEEYDPFGSIVQDVIKEDLKADYGSDQAGYVCIAWKNRNAAPDDFHQEFFEWPEERIDIVHAISTHVAEGCCVWKPTALLKYKERRATQPSNVISFEIDGTLPKDKQRLLSRFSPSLLKSGRKGHFHVKIYLEEALEQDELAYWSRYVGSALGITGHADSGGKFQPQDLLRIAATLNTKPELGRGGVEVMLARRSTRKVSLEALRSILSAFPPPNASTLAITSIEPQRVDTATLSLRLRSKLKEPSVDGFRSEATFEFVQLCKEQGLNPGQTLYLARKHAPTLEKAAHNLQRVEKDVLRCWNKGERSVVEIEQGIFAQSEILQFIHDEAKKRMIAPMAALGNVLVRTCLAIPYDVVLPATFGSTAGLNLFFVFAAESGAGKGIASKAKIIEFPKYRIIPQADQAGGDGSGSDGVMVIGQEHEDACRPVKAASAQALATMFVELAKDEKGAKSMVQYAYARHVQWDEVDTLSAHLANKQDTMSAELRSAWSGGVIGTFTKNAENRLYMEEDTYRLVASWHAQYKQCGPLFGTAGGGFLQRMLFVRAHDPNKVIVREAHETRAVMLPKKWPASFTLSSAVQEQILEDHRSDRYRDQEDQHRNLNRLKIAAVLAVLHGGTTVNAQWWETAGAVMDHSDQVKAEIRTVLRQQEDDQERAVGRRTAIRTMGQQEVIGLRMKRVEERILEVLDEFPDGRARSRVKARLTDKQKPFFDNALQTLVSDGLVKVKGARLHKVSLR